MSRDTIDFKRCYVDVSGGSAVTGLMLSQIIFWFLPDKKGYSKVRIKRDGREWIAKEHDAWWDECRITKKQAKGAIDKLKAAGLIDVEHWMFAGKRTTHIHLNESVLTEKLAKLSEVPVEPKGADRCDQKGSTGGDKRGAPCTEITDIENNRENLVLSTTDSFFIEEQLSEPASDSSFGMDCHVDHRISDSDDATSATLPDTEERLF